MRPPPGMDVAQPAADDATREASTVEALERLRDGVAFRLGALLRAAHQLAALRAVHEELEVSAQLDPAFEQALIRAHPRWRDPLCLSEAGDVLPELLRQACGVLDELVIEEPAEAPMRAPADRASVSPFPRTWQGTSVSPARPAPTVRHSPETLNREGH